MFQTKKSNPSKQNSYSRDYKKQDTNLLESNKNISTKLKQSIKSTKKQRQRLFTLGQAYQVDNMGVVNNFGAENQSHNRFKLQSQLSVSDNQSTNTNVFKSKKRDTIMIQEEDELETEESEQKNEGRERPIKEPKTRAGKRPKRPTREPRKAQKPSRTKNNQQKSVNMKMNLQNENLIKTDPEYGGTTPQDPKQTSDAVGNEITSIDRERSNTRQSQHQIIKNNIQNSINNESMLSEQMSNFINLESLQQFNLGDVEGVNLIQKKIPNDPFEKKNFKRAKTTALSSINQIPNLKNSKISFEKGLDNVMRTGKNLGTHEKRLADSKTSSVNSISFEGRQKKNHFFVKNRELLKKPNRNNVNKLNGKKISFGFFQKKSNTVEEGDLANDPDLILKRDTGTNKDSNDNKKRSLFGRNSDQVDDEPARRTPTRKKNPFLNSIENVSELIKLKEKSQNRSMKPHPHKSSLFSDSTQKNKKKFSLGGTPQKSTLMRNNSMLPPEIKTSPMDMKFGSLKPKSMRKISESPISNSWGIGLKQRKASAKLPPREPMIMPFNDAQIDSIDLMDEGSDMEDLDLELRDTIGERPALVIPDIKKLIADSGKKTNTNSNRDGYKNFTSERKANPHVINTSRTFGSEQKSGNGNYSGKKTSRNTSNFGSNNGSFNHNTIMIDTFGPAKKKELQEEEAGNKRGSTVRAKQFTFNHPSTFINSLGK